MVTLGNGVPGGTHGDAYIIGVVGENNSGVPEEHWGSPHLSGIHLQAFSSFCQGYADLRPIFDINCRRGADQSPSAPPAHRGGSVPVPVHPERSPGPERTKPGPGPPPLTEHHRPPRPLPALRAVPRRFHPGRPGAASALWAEKSAGTAEPPPRRGCSPRPLMLFRMKV